MASPNIDALLARIDALESAEETRQAEAAAAKGAAKNATKDPTKMSDGELLSALVRGYIEWDGM